MPGMVASILTHELYVLNWPYFMSVPVIYMLPRQEKVVSMTCYMVMTSHDAYCMTSIELKA
jgi:hypothetical protein